MNDLKLNKNIFKTVRPIFSWRRFWTKNCRNGFRGCWRWCGCGYGGRWCGRPFGKQLHLKWKPYQLDRFETGLTGLKPVWHVWKLVKIFWCFIFPVLVHKVYLPEAGKSGNALRCDLFISKLFWKYSAYLLQEVRLNDILLGSRQTDYINRMIPFTDTLSLTDCIDSKQA
jgi:hypothetical protein